MKQGMPDTIAEKQSRFLGQLRRGIISPMDNVMGASLAGIAGFMRGQ